MRTITASTRAARTTAGACRSRSRSTPRCWPRPWSAASSTGSLALLADAGHVLSDVGAIGARARGARRSPPAPAARAARIGLQRSEVLAALVNGLALVVIAVLVAIAAVGRLSDPPDVEGAGVLALGLFGLAGNVAATWVLARGDRVDVNLEARPAAFVRRRARVAGGRRVRRGDPRHGLARGGPGGEPRGRRPDPARVRALVMEPLGVLMETAPGRPRRRGARAGAGRGRRGARGARAPRLDRDQRASPRSRRTS